MIQYFAPAYKGNSENLDELCVVAPNKQQLYEAKSEPQPNTVLSIGNELYSLLPEVDKHIAKIVGFLSAKKKSDEKQSYRSDAIARLCYGDTCALITAKTDESTVGYLATEQENAFIAITRPSPFIFLLPLSFLVLLVTVLIYFFWAPTVPPNVHTDELINGGLTPSIVAQLDPAYFNIKINATPIVKNGSMNLRVENSERNLYNCTVEVEMEYGESTEIIYKSPLINPNQALEYATVAGDFIPGVYEGKANFKFLTDDGKLLGNATVSLTINIV